MSILNPKIRFVSSADGVGFETLFVDVLLFSFQGSFDFVSDATSLIYHRLYQESRTFLISFSLVCDALFISCPSDDYYNSMRVFKESTYFFKKTYDFSPFV